MYSTCLFCNSSLGHNEAIESFPVGRRLAFDADKGRLWVVCRKCERWNLTPLEERWEAIEECERAFRGTRLRVSTDQVGLARLREGLELVRIGQPQRPEMAAWRYGDQFGRRRRRALLLGAGVAAAAVGYVVVGPVMGLVGGSPVAFNFINVGRSLYRGRKVVARVELPGGDEGRVMAAHVDRAALRWDRALDRWSLEVVHERTTRQKAAWYAYDRGYLSSTITGDAALRAARMILPHVNANGATRRTVRDAVEVLDDAGEPGSLFAHVARTRLPSKSGQLSQLALRSLPAPVRLALEMAAHEETERRALEGELHLLESAWREAEEIAKIADDLFLPDSVDAELRRLRDRNG